MSSDEVRLVHTSSGIFMPAFDEVASTNIALHLARHAALMRVVEAVRSCRDAVDAEFFGRGKRSEIEQREAVALCTKRRVELFTAVDAYDAAAPGRQGEAPRA